MAAEQTDQGDKIHSFLVAMDEIKQTIQTFAVTPQHAALASMRFKDAAGEECLVTVMMIRSASYPESDVVGTLDEKMQVAAEDYRFLKTEGEEAYVKRLRERFESEAAKQDQSFN